MEEIVEIKSIVNKDAIKVFLQEATSYIKPFLIDSLNSNIILIYKLIQTTRNPLTKTENYDSSIVSELDLTGSPLECPYSPIKYNDTLVSCILSKHWQSEEERHGPIPVAEARNLVSLCNLYVRSWMLPVWIVCDGNDPLHTVLLSSLCDNESGWVTSSTVHVQGQCSYEEAVTLAGKVKMEHYTKSRMSKLETTMLMSQTYDDCGISWTNENSSMNTIKLRLSWTCSSVVSTPPNYAKTTLEMLIVVEQPSSAAYYLWKQLKLLNELAALLTSLKSRKGDDTVELPKFDNGDVCVTGRTEILNLLHESDYIAIGSQGSIIPEEDSSGKLQSVNLAVREVMSGKTLYLDITLSLFLLLAQCGDSENLVTCLNHVFREVQAGDTKLFVHPNNTTTIAHILLELMRKDKAPAELTGVKAMELLLEIGLEKLSKDYAHIFVSTDVATLEQLGLPAYNSNILASATEKLDVLGRLHVTLEILLLLESQMSFSVNTLYPVASYTLNNISTQVKSFSQLLESANIKFQAPVITREVLSIITRRYSSWSMQLTSEGKKCKVNTILHFSTLPIFPYLSSEKSDSQLCDENEDLYCSKLTSLSNKLK